MNDKNQNDFLSQFNENNYSDKKGSTKASNKIENHIQEKTEPIKKKDSKSRKKEVLQESKTKRKKISSPEHIIEKDTSYHKRKMIRYGIIGGSSVAILGIVTLTFILMNRVEIKDFTGSTLNDARTWGLTNNITIETETEFNLEFEENQIFDQNVEPGSHLQRGAVLNLTVSQGADPDEFIELPDFESITTAELRQWRQSVLALNINIVEEYDDDVEAGQFISKEFGNSSVTAENYTRADGLIVVMSKGIETFTVPNFVNRKQEDVESWATENELRVTIEQAASNEVEIGTVISQSIEARERISRNDAITFVISAGESIVVPNFNHLTHEEALAIPELQVQARHRYHAEIPFGRVISQSEAAGTELFGENASVIVTYSLGRPYIDNLIGTSEREVAEIFFTLNSHGANITYTIRYVDSPEPRGTIVSMSRYAQFLNMTDHVDINVSRGNR